MTTENFEDLERAILGAKIAYELEGDGRRTRPKLATRMYRWLEEIEVDRNLDHLELKEDNSQ